MSADTVTLRLEDVGAAESHTYATELREYLQSEDRGLEVEIQRDDPATQDLGATLVLLAGTAMARTIAKGIQAWMAKRGGTSVVVTTAKGSIKIHNANSGDIAALERSIRQLVGSDE